MANRRVLVLGGGVCGLAAAWRVLERDPRAKVTILECEPEPGGLARSLTVDGQVTDLGPHRIFTELEDVRAFLATVTAGEMVEVTRASRMWLRGHWIEYPPRPLEILSLLGPAQLAGAGMSWAWTRAEAKLRPAAERRESFESLMVDAFGPELYAFLVGPYAEKVWKVPPSTMHADIARVRVSAGGLDQLARRLLRREDPNRPTATRTFHYIAGGVATLVRKLRDGVEARGGRLLLRAAAASIERNGDTMTVRDSGGTAHEADHVISTIPLPDLVAMLHAAEPDAQAAATAAELRFITNVLVCVVADRPEITASQWLYFPGADTLFNRAYEPRNFHPSMAPDGRAMIVAEVTMHERAPEWRLSDGELREATLDGLGHAGILHRSEVRATRVHRIPRTYPLYDLEYRDRLTALVEALGRWPRVVSAGRQGLFLHNNMDHSIHMGFRAADRIAESPREAGPAFYEELRKFQLFRIVD
jgi:protoporphyrinogen oxidase